MQARSQVLGEVLYKFIVSGEETLLLACDEVTDMIGSKDKKYKNEILDLSSSINIYRTDNIVGNTGPTVFHLSVNQNRTGFMDKFLEEIIYSMGSTTIMNATAFLTEDVWTRIIPFFIKGLQSLPIFK